MADDFEILQPGMAVQLARRREAIAKGMQPIGWKIGVSVPALQAHFGLTRPCMGWLDGRRLLRTGASIDFLPEVSMRVEPEVCLRVGEKGRLDAIAPALEIVDFSVAPKNLFDLLSCSILHLATVVGEFLPPARAAELGRRWPKLEVTGQAVPALGEGLVPADLQQAVDFVRDMLARFELELVAGDLIMAGSYAATVPPLDRGVRALGDFGPLGTVSVTRAG